ncbi:MAG: hypothetical protein IT379_39165 [Deltaproteobacteria bacterium]|nr:hypothetical protein [Deltaproteobacteria bacterium]
MPTLPDPVVPAKRPARTSLRPPPAAPVARAAEPGTPPAPDPAQRRADRRKRIV